MKDLGDLEKNLRRFGEKHVWRFGENMFGENVGDLEKRGRRSYGDFVLDFIMEWRRARRP